MSVSKLYYLAGISFGGTLVSEIQDGTPGTNTEELVARPSGSPHPLFRSVRGQKPGMPFTSNALGAILAQFSTSAFCADLSGANTDLLFRQGKNLGFRYADNLSDHYRLRIAKAFLYWETIAADHQQDASIACRVVAVSTAGEAPIVGGGTTIAGTVTSDEWYTLGPTKINGTWLGNERGFSLASGVQTEEIGAGGQTYDSYVGGKTTDPVLTLRALGDPWGGYAAGGTALTNIVQYLRRKESDTHNYADSAEQHIKITCPNGLVFPEGVSGGADPSETTLRIGLRSASYGTEPVAIETGVAIA